jgi:predicted nucleic acid-binding protein
MKHDQYLFDSSAIITLIERRKSDVLLEGWTVDLAFYELGNAVWKMVNLYKKLSIDDAKVVLDTFMSVYSMMNKIHGLDSQSILMMALQEGITYYDATYLYAAVVKKMTLVTDDKKLKHAGSKYVNVLSSSEIV